MTELVVFALVALVVAVAGAAVGMLLVPRLERLTEPSDEEPGAGDDPSSD